MWTGRHSSPCEPFSMVDSEKVLDKAFSCSKTEMLRVGSSNDVMMVWMYATGLVVTYCVCCMLVDLMGGAFSPGGQ